VNDSLWFMNNKNIYVGIKFVQIMTVKIYIIIVFNSIQTTECGILTKC